jgi:hypothetical protein
MPKNSSTRFQKLFPQPNIKSRHKFLLIYIFNMLSFQIININSALTDKKRKLKK